MKRIQKNHFWLGAFLNKNVFFDYFGEEYSEDDNVPISKFAKDQGECWYDHDFVEMGFNESANSVQELVKPYSYSDQYAAELAAKADELQIHKPNSFVFIETRQIKVPRTVKNNEFELHYLGELAIEI